LFSIQQTEEIHKVFRNEICENAKINVDLAGEKIAGSKLLKKCDVLKICCNVRYQRLKYRAGKKK